MIDPRISPAARRAFLVAAILVAFAACTSPTAPAAAPATDPVTPSAATFPGGGSIPLGGCGGVCSPWW